MESFMAMFCNRSCFVFCSVVSGVRRHTSPEITVLSRNVWSPATGFEGIRGVVARGPSGDPSCYPI
jgi:hypothetical protein